MLRVPFTEKKHPGVRVGKRPERDSSQTLEMLTWAGASFFLGYLAFAAALGFFTR